MAKTGLKNNHPSPGMAPLLIGNKTNGPATAVALTPSLEIHIRLRASGDGDTVVSPERRPLAVIIICRIYRPYFCGSPFF